MIAKLIVGKSFGGCVRYLLEREQSKVLDSAGVRDYDTKTIIADLNAQRKLRPQFGNAVGHTVLSWSNEDRTKLTVEKMAQHAREYMEKMGIKNTQYVTVLHSDKEHPHLHIVYNRVDNDGKTIGNFNHWHKSRKICREMTEHYGYHLGKGKAKVNRQALKGNDRLRYAIHDALKDIMAKATTWKQVETMLAKHGIGIHYKYRSGTDEVQGISFEKDGVKFKGSAIDRKYSFANVEKQLSENRAMGITHSITESPTLADQVREVLGQQEKPIAHGLEVATEVFGAFLDAALTPVTPEPEPDPLWRKKKKKTGEEQSRGISR